MCNNITEESLNDCRLSAKRIEWVGGDGKTRFWESVERRTTLQGAEHPADAVAVIAKTHGPDPEVLVIKQFRPPLGAYCLEIPAGLIDPGESPEMAALRELKEETGYVATLQSISPLTFNDPGITNANMLLCVCDIDLNSEENKNVEQNCHDGEFIQVMWAPYTNLLEFLLQQKSADTEIDARLFMFAMGYHQANLVAEKSKGSEDGSVKNSRQGHALVRSFKSRLSLREVISWAVTGVALLAMLR